MKLKATVKLNMGGEGKSEVNSILSLILQPGKKHFCNDFRCRKEKSLERRETKSGMKYELIVWYERENQIRGATKKLQLKARSYVLLNWNLIHDYYLKITSRSLFSVYDSYSYFDKKDNDKYWAETHCYLLRCIFPKMNLDLVLNIHD